MLWTRLLSWAAGQPWLIPSLGPTAYLVAAQVPHQNTRFYNVLVGHPLALGAGFFALLVTGAWRAPSVLQDQQMALRRVFAAAISVAVTMLLGLLFKASHSPAAATAFLVALGAL